jgi:hypothetical protein
VPATKARTRTRASLRWTAVVIILGFAALYVGLPALSE